MSLRDYKKLYPLQDRVLTWWETLNLPFYLTGGTALGRFYLNHRFSEDLDFFVNSDPKYQKYVEIIWKNIETHFKADRSKTVIFDDFSRFYIVEDGVTLKLEFVNDISHRHGQPISVYFGNIDTPANILSNKITAIVGRNEPKDMFDIVHISLNYNFNWVDIFLDVKDKAIINEIDVEQRINTFPVEWFENVNWLTEKPELEYYKKLIKIIADDFLAGKDNSVCQTSINLFDAHPSV